MSKLWDKEWLRDQYVNQRNSYRKIAEKAGVSHMNVREWVEKHGFDKITLEERNREKTNPIKNKTHRLYGRKRWVETAEEVRKKDDYRCQGCGLAQSNTDSTFHVHHIVPVVDLVERYGEECDEIYDKSNLVTLCDSCHANWEGVPVMPKVI